MLLLVWEPHNLPEQNAENGEGTAATQENEENKQEELAVSNTKGDELNASRRDPV